MHRKQFERGPSNPGGSLLITGVFLLATLVMGQALYADGSAPARTFGLFLAALYLTSATLTPAAVPLRCRAFPLVRERGPLVIDFKALVRDIHKTKADDRVGACWQSLADSDIAVYRRPEDGFADYLRVRILIRSHRACLPIVFRNY